VPIPADRIMSDDNSAAVVSKEGSHWFLNPTRDNETFFALSAELINTKFIRKDMDSFAVGLTIEDAEIWATAQHHFSKLYFIYEITVPVKVLNLLTPDRVTPEEKARYVKNQPASREEMMAVCLFSSVQSYQHHYYDCSEKELPTLLPIVTIKPNTEFKGYDILSVTPLKNYSASFQAQLDFQYCQVRSKYPPESLKTLWSFGKHPENLVITNKAHTAAGTVAAISAASTAAVIDSKSSEESAFSFSGIRTFISSIGYTKRNEVPLARQPNSSLSNIQFNDVQTLIERLRGEISGIRSYSMSSDNKQRKLHKIAALEKVIELANTKPIDEVVTEVKAEYSKYKYSKVLDGETLRLINHLVEVPLVITDGKTPSK
jgi:hypothetical protein